MTSSTGCYERNLEVNLHDLLDRIKSGRYQAPPVRRAYIPKADGTQRPLGADSDEAGHAFQSEAGRCSELMPARYSDAKPATWCIARQVVCDDHLLEWRGQAADSGVRFFRRLSPLSSMR